MAPRTVRCCTALDAEARHALQLQRLYNSFEERQEALAARHAQEKRALQDEIDELVCQLAAMSADNRKLQDQASELLVEKLQGWL